MSRCRRLPFVTALALVMPACDLMTGPGQNVDSLENGFASMLLGYDNVQSSFDAGTSGGQSVWLPSGGRAAAGGGGGGGMCGGGVGAGFGLGVGFGHVGNFRLPAECVFEASSARVVCPATTRNGLTVNRSAAYATANGTAQSAFDSLTTNSVNVRVSVSGTTTRRNGAVSTVEHASNRTVTGLAAGSAQRTVNGTSAGTESTTGTNQTGNFTAVRVMGDTTTNVIVPATTGTTAVYPTSGTIVRSMKVTLTYEGQTPTTSTRREVVTFNGTSTATVVITRDGETKNCTIALPRGRPVCE